MSKSDLIQSRPEHTIFKDYLRDLYVKLLNFLATCNVYLSDNMFIRTARCLPGMVGLD